MADDTLWTKLAEMPEEELRALIEQAKAQAEADPEFQKLLKSFEPRALTAEELFKRY